jgi:cytochrome c oxidase subunit 2
VRGLVLAVAIAALGEAPGSGLRAPGSSGSTAAPAQASAKAPAQAPAQPPAPAPTQPPAPAPAQPPAGPAAPARRISITAKKYEFTPAEIQLERGVPVVLELRALDRAHGFSLPDLGVEIRVEPGPAVEVPLAPAKAGTFPFRCHVFCGSGHEEMSGTLVVA